MRIKFLSESTPLTIMYYCVDAFGNISLHFMYVLLARKNYICCNMKAKTTWFTMRKSLPK